MKLYTVPEVAQLLGCSAQAIRWQCAQGKIKGAEQKGGRWLIPERAIRKIQVNPHKDRQQETKD